MFKQYLKLEVRGALERVYSLSLASDSPLGEINEALSTMKSVVLKQMNEQHERELEDVEKLKILSEEQSECCGEKPSEECCKESGEDDA